MLHRQREGDEQSADLPVLMTTQGLQRMACDWVDRHHREIFRFLARLTGKIPTAEDLTQETFLRAFRSFRQLRDPEAVRPWLYRIAWNAYLDHRRSARAAERSAESRAERPEFRDDSPDAEDRLLNRELGVRLRRVVDRLPPRQRSVFLLRLDDQLSFEEIGRCLQCSAVVARSHFRHALQRVRWECRQEGLHL